MLISNGRTEWSPIQSVIITSDKRFTQLSNGDRTEWSPIQSVIITSDKRFTYI